ncbi:MAG: hypothetical protein LPK46_11010 [Bacteroidota bacterium]|nr:hypothetical protein [Bacteroidota bacterium]MDX5447523.1 hypothetical protein [Bacteroidota bacterium]MDX5506653.1 hypothetical protein [Bacteroidota bacterium]
MVNLRAFRATDEPETCLKFIEGHQRVLSSIGVKKVTSSTEEWMENPSAFVLVVESEEDGEILGGSRIHAADGKTLLPIETATGYLDPGINDLVKGLSRFGVAEICGLWNSRKVAGMGIGSIYLNRASIAISEQLGLNRLISLCAPYTVEPAKSYGYRVEEGVGNNGTFYYPKLDLIATVMVLDDVRELDHADPNERAKVLELRSQWNQVRHEREARKEVDIRYNLKLENVDPTEFHLKVVEKSIFDEKK